MAERDNSWTWRQGKKAGLRAAARAARKFLHESRHGEWDGGRYYEQALLDIAQHCEREARKEARRG